MGNEKTQCVVDILTGCGEERRVEIAVVESNLAMISKVCQGEPNNIT